MAPNRKQVNLILSASPADLANLQSTIQPKYLPLTHPNEQQQHQERLQQDKKTQNDEATVSYWDWPADTQEEERNERQKDMFSAASIESNLIRAAANMAPSESATIAANDAYWAEESAASDEPVQSTTKPQHSMMASYWDWHTASPEEEKKSVLAGIVEEENARLFVSASLHPKPSTTSESQQIQSTKQSNDQYWSWEAPVIMAAHALDATHPLANYWDEATNDDSSGKNAMIQELKAYEHARQLLSANHVVKNLQQQQSNPTEVVTAKTSSSDDYWTWSEPLGDAYWDTPATSVVACGGAGYWDM